MVVACHVILLDLWWNPTTEDQAVDRARRDLSCYSNMTYHKRKNIMSSGIVSFYRHWFCLTFFDNCLTYTRPSVPGGSGSRLFLGLKEKFFFFPTNYESLASHFVLSSKYHKPTTIQKSQKVYLGVRRDSPPHVRNSESLNKTTRDSVNLYMLRYVLPFAL
jgi:hypothetical protein